jgi:eukaryotic-like serine/threonine-protein kinase
MQPSRRVPRPLALLLLQITERRMSMVAINNTPGEGSTTSAASSAPSRAPDPLIGRVINDRYRVISIIARGGMGRVYRAEQAALGRLVALKILTPTHMSESDPSFHKR